MSSSSEFSSVHLEHAVPNVAGDFDIACSPGTDIWDKAPATHQFNAPIIYRTTTKDAFISATVAVSADWKDRYDQGGLCFVIRAADRTRWIKIGIELDFGVPNAGVVVKDNFADWSLRPLPYGSTNSIAVQARIQEDGDLWVYALGPNDERIAMRQITWWDALPGNTEIWVGPYAAKPAYEGGKEPLKVHFNRLSVDTRSDVAQ
ncbi:hypothetical protein CkaCkLH20_11155 [Colletotrichum karsti]|uniref:Uncharacterized protein n=1 Tax=Colletotrichum karsti TaxID=1095194 RepID=A0A9P6HUL2_9PEZI|nr:uncharacterized protein CkaCkLH20_11155 [Colletotrichum karsti]KAF9871508.1 hypothetical protein CkaCkLH20_11155 [Colletotrichum karsti]